LQQIQVQSRHDPLRESAFAVAIGAKADIGFLRRKCLLMTQSGQKGLPVAWPSDKILKK
jgi:hypothetical protein